ncbi:MAG: tRNA (adenosine(37)-N6)-dimethylallyltransferase MiaA, partial [Alphaproteobacteria bacterium]
PLLAGCVEGGSTDTPLAIVVGGTGLYFRALTDGLTDIPDIPEAVVARWQKRLREEGVNRLHDRLAAQDKDGAAALSPGDPQRIVRALSVLEATGRTLGEWQTRGRETASQPLIAAGATIRLALTPDRDWLIHRIAQRFDKMVAAGAVNEVEAFLRRDLDGSLPAMKAIGVNEFAAFLDQSIPLDQAVERAKIRTRQYAKRQMTWIRNQMADWTFIVPD